MIWLPFIVPRVGFDLRLVQWLFVDFVQLLKLFHWIQFITGFTYVSECFGKFGFAGQ